MLGVGWYQEFTEHAAAFYDSLGRGPHLDVPADTFDEAPEFIHVETEHANYAQFMSIPYRKETVNENVLEEADAIVLESRVTPYEDWSLEDRLHSDVSWEKTLGALTTPRNIPSYLEELMEEAEEREYRPIIQQNLEDERLPMYLVDLPTDAHSLELSVSNSRLPNWVRTRGLKSLLPGKTAMKSLFRTHPAYWPLRVLLGASGYIPKTFETGKTPISYSQLIKAPTPSGLQSAVAAEKIESQVAPKLEEELDRKPNILLVYDVKDQDIAPYLNHPRLRKTVIDKHAYTHYALTDTDYLDKVYEFRFEEETENIVHTKDGDSVPYTTTMHEVDSIQPLERPSIIPWPSLLREYAEEGGAFFERLENRHDPSQPDPKHHVPDDPEAPVTPRLED